MSVRSNPMSCARRVDLVLDVADRRDRLQLGGEQVGVLLEVLRSLTLAGLDQDQQIVEASEIADRLLEGVDDPIVLRYQIQDVAVQGEAAAEDDRQQDDQERDQEDQAIAATRELLDAQEEPLLAAALHRPEPRPARRRRIKSPAAPRAPCRP